jgi:hypothetical protein
MEHGKRNSIKYIIMCCERRIAIQLRDAREALRLDQAHDRALKGL